MPAMQPHRHAASSCEVRKPHSSRGSESLVFRTAGVNGWSQLPLRPLRDLQIKPGAVAQQQFLKSWAARLLDPAPFFDRNKNGGLHAPAGNHLRALLDRGL